MNEAAIVEVIPEAGPGREETWETPPRWEPGATYSFRRPLTVAEYYELVSEGSPTELVDGVIVVNSPVTNEHEALFDFLHTVLHLYVEGEKLGVVRGSRTGVYVDDNNLPEPDLLFIRADRLDIIDHLDVRGAPDLVMEIISPSERRRAIINKEARYERRGVRELWRIDQPRKEVVIFRLDDTGHFVERPPEEPGIVRSEIVDGFWLREEWLWCPPYAVPAAVDVVREIRGLGKVLDDLGREAVIGELGPEAIVSNLPDEATLAALRRKLGPEAFAELLRSWIERSEDI
jgi:Uma2 family endonuclease